MTLGNFKGLDQSGLNSEVVLIMNW